MAISKDEVKYIAQLAKLHFEEDEAEKFAKEFENILEQFKTLDALDPSIRSGVAVKPRRICGL